MTCATCCGGRQAKCREAALALPNLGSPLSLPRVRRLRLVLAQALRQLAADGQAPMDFTAAPHAADAPPSHRPPTLPLLRESISQVGAADLVVSTWAFIFDMDIHQKSGNVRVFGGYCQAALLVAVALRPSSCKMPCAVSRVPFPATQHCPAKARGRGCRTQATEDLYAALDARQQLFAAVPAGGGAGDEGADILAAVSLAESEVRACCCVHVAAFMLLLSCCCFHAAAS